LKLIAPVLLPSAPKLVPLGMQEGASH
jgi:hypothetical protein